MEFLSIGKKRPIRLCEQTRRFALDSLNARYGRDTQKTAFVEVGERDSELGAYEIYDLGIKKIAESAPIRICEGELISGAATLGDAINHHVPARYKGERVASRSTSHLTVDFESVLKYGVKDIERRASEALEEHRGTERETFSRSCVSCLEALRTYHGRYLDALSGMPEYRKNYENLKNVPYNPPSSFHEAVQSIWFVFSFLRLCGDWPGIGRIDKMLGPYLKKDLEKGIITLDEAREILAHFFIKGCEWITGNPTVSGDAQHYQNLVLSGVDEDGNDVTNEVTYLVLDIIEETGISDFPTTVRMSKNTDERLYDRVCEVIGYGGGVVAVYNEELIINAMLDRGYPLREARNFANDGCWEVQVPGKTNFGYLPFDGLAVLQKKTLGSYSENVHFDDFDSLYNAYIADLQNEVRAQIERRMGGFKSKDITQSWNCSARPCTTVSLFEAGCIESGLSYENGGPVYNVASPHIGGIADVANSLYAIKKAVFDDGIVSFDELMTALSNNWEGYEELRMRVSSYPCYGTDNDEVDAIYADILEKFSRMGDISGYEDTPFIFPCGVSTFGRQITWAGSRLASPFGRFAAEVLSGNCSPTPGTDVDGATAVIASYCKADHSKLTTGSALDLKLALSGRAGLEGLKGLIKAFITLGGFFMQPDAVDAEILKKAQADPESYKSLSVRVSGWNARFVTLSKEWQDMIISISEK